MLTGPQCGAGWAQQNMVTRGLQWVVGAAWHPLGAVVGFDDEWDKPSSTGGCAIVSWMGNQRQWKVAPWMTKAPWQRPHGLCGRHH